MINQKNKLISEGRVNTTNDIQSTVDILLSNGTLMSEL